MAIELETDTPRSFNNPIELVGFDMSKRAATKAYKNAGVKPSEISCVELHDCFSVMELLTYETLGLC